jgi:hypothetical protein
MSARYLYGEFDPIMAPVLDAQVVSICDLVGLSSGNIVRAEDETWATAVAAPSAPTVADSAVSQGSGLTNAATGVKISYQFPWGEGALSAAGTATPTANAAIKMTGIDLSALTAPVIAVNIYVETAAGSGTYKLYQQVPSVGVEGIGQVMITGYGKGQAPPAGVTSGALDVSQYNFAQRFVGVSAQKKISGTNVIVPGNSVKNIIRVDQAGVIEFDCASATFAVGDYVGPDKATGSALLSQQVVAVAGEALAIGKVVEAGTSITKVKVRLLRSKATGKK